MSLVLVEPVKTSISFIDSHIVCIGFYLLNEITLEQIGTIKDNWGNESCERSCLIVMMVQSYDHFSCCWLVKHTIYLTWLFRCIQLSKCNSAISSVMSVHLKVHNFSTCFCTHMIIQWLSHYKKSNHFYVTNTAIRIPTHKLGMPYAYNSAQ